MRLISSEELTMVKAVPFVPPEVKKAMQDVKHKIVVLSGKGGVGKTTVATNLAMSFAKRNLTAGVLDVDIYGPNVPKLLGLEGQHPKADEEMIYPIEGPLKTKVMSMGFLLRKTDDAVAWRGPLVAKAVTQFLGNVRWGELDVLVIDLPPGTGDEILSILQSIPDADGVVVVSTPQEVAVLDARRAIQLAEKMGVDVVAGFAGRVPGLEPMECIPKFKELWGEHAKFAEDHGVKIAFENCPMGRFHLPPGGINMMCLPDVWEAAFNEVQSDALGLEWDPSHLICMFIDPVANLRQFGSKVYHVHAKDAHVHKDLLARYGIYHEGVIEHCFPGLGDTDWGLAIKELRRQGYDGALDIEGWHDAVFRDHPGGPQWEREGLLVALRHLSQWVV